MDVLIDVISKTANYKRTGRRICLPLVIHCVPGAGKSTLIRKLLSLDSRFIAYTFGVPDKISLGCRGIVGIEEFKTCENRLVLIDEYLEGDCESYNPLAVFGDPFQSTGNFEKLEAHFINSVSYRIGEQTCNLLRSFDFDIHSAKTDKVFIGGLFEEELTNIVIAIEEDVKKLLKAHGVPFYCLDKIRGSEFPIVTFCTAENSIPDPHRAEFFVALTRHSKVLRILSPDATFTSS